MATLPNCRLSFAAAGRVGTLLLEAERIIPGRLDFTTGDIAPDELQNPQVGDVLDDLAELVLRNGGQVIVLPTGRLPSRTGLAALYRY